MIDAAGIPDASDGPEELADWLELDALFSASRQSSRVSLVRVLRRTGTTEIVEAEEEDYEEGDVDPGSALSQRAAEDAFAEIEARAIACGASGYPFEVDQGSVRLRCKAAESDYVFMLLLTRRGPTSGHHGTAVLFESLCTNAAHRYFGGAANLARVTRFGSPRLAPFTTMRKALDTLCVDLGEGGGCKEGRGDHTGDGQVDIVAWRPFPDSKAAKLIGFGQCAAGRKSYDDKLNELDGVKFAKKWMRQPLAVDPVRFFFVPWCVSREDWETTAIDAGILFDRCRIVACLDSGLDPALVQAREKSTARLMKELARP